MILTILKDYCAKIRAEGEEAGTNKIFLPQSNWAYVPLLPFIPIISIALVFKPEESFFRILIAVIAAICVSAYAWANVIFLTAYLRADKVRRLAGAKAKAENTGGQ